MRQAIEETCILDVVRNHTTCQTYFRLVKAIEDGADLSKRKGARARPRGLRMVRVPEGGTRKRAPGSSRFGALRTGSARQRALTSQTVPIGGQPAIDDPH